MGFRFSKRETGLGIIGMRGKLNFNGGFFNDKCIGDELQPRKNWRNSRDRTYCFGIPERKIHRKNHLH